MSANEVPAGVLQSTAGVTDEWQDEHPAGAFARWFAELEAAAAETIAHVVRAASIVPGMTVLDVGCGAGIPALRLAEMVGAAGSVVATDPSRLLIAAVTANARERGLTNVTPVQASAAGLPFPPASFDAATCNFGVMFFTDVQAGLTTIRDTLRPGARAAFAAWGPPAENMLMGPIRQVTSAYLTEPPAPPEPDTPNPMRFAAPGSLSAKLTAAGYADVQEESVVVRLRWPGRAQRLIDCLLDISNVEQDVPPDRHEEMRADLLRAYERFEVGEETHLPARIVIASGSHGP